MKASTFAFRSDSLNDSLPMAACTLPAASFRYSILPALNSRTAVRTSSVTVPFFGDGMRPLGPRILPSFEMTLIVRGIAMATSNSYQPPSIFLARSSMPTPSAPDSVAIWASAPSANTMTRRALPMPLGRDTEPRMDCSLFLGSIASLTAISIDWSLFVVENDLRILTASSTGYFFCPSTLAASALYRLLRLRIVLSFDLDSHVPRGALDRLDRGIHGPGVHVLDLDLGDLLEVLPGHGPHLLLVGGPASLHHVGVLLQEHARRGGLVDHVERAVLVDRHDARDHQARVLLRGVVEAFHEFADVDAVLAERRAHGRSGSRLPAGALQLDLRHHFFFGRHGSSYTFSTCQYSSSTRVARPKIVIVIPTRPFWELISSTMPSKFSNAPSFTRTVSPF